MGNIRDLNWMHKFEQMQIFQEIFGHNIICNYCLDYLKAIKDYQFMLYGTLLTSFTMQVTQFTEDIKSGSVKDE